MRLSVVIPVYNVAQYLPDCLDLVAMATRLLPFYRLNDGGIQEFVAFV